jgi:hypothetical protein
LPGISPRRERESSHEERPVVTEEERRDSHTSTLDTVGMVGDTLRRCPGWLINQRVDPPRLSRREANKASTQQYLDGERSRHQAGGAEEAGGAGRLK